MKKLKSDLDGHDINLLVCSILDLFTDQIADFTEDDEEENFDILRNVVAEIFGDPDYRRFN